VNRNDDANPHAFPARMSIDCDWVREHAPIHALGALEPEESDQLESHLLLCRACDREVSALMDVTALLGAGVVQAAPPATLKRNLMAAINANAPARSREPIVLREVPALANEPEPHVVPSVHTWLTSRALFGSIVGALLLLGLWTINTHQQLGEQRTQVGRLERQNEALTVHLSSIQAGQQFFGNDGFWLPLSVVDANAGEAGGIVMSGTQNTTTLLSVWNMPDEHDTYHVLCESKRGELLSAGEIQVNDRGSGSVTLNLPAPVTEYRAVHVVPMESATYEADILTHDILQLLIGEPTAVATTET
jgi:hypothetical protein